MWEKRNTTEHQKVAYFLYGLLLDQYIASSCVNCNHDMVSLALKCIPN